MSVLKDVERGITDRRLPDAKYSRKIRGIKTTQTENQTSGVERRGTGVMKLIDGSRESSFS